VTQWNVVTGLTEIIVMIFRRIEFYADLAFLHQHEAGAGRMLAEIRRTDSETDAQ
jgi:hypothetical protein